MFKVIEGNPTVSSDSSMDDCNVFRAHRCCYHLTRSDSSMDDCNRCWCGLWLRYRGVQIPLWTIVTSFLCSPQQLSASSDSSMDDCNLLNKSDISAFASVQIPLWTIVTL